MRTITLSLSMAATFPVPVVGDDGPKSELACRDRGGPNMIYIPNSQQAERRSKGLKPPQGKAGEFCIQAHGDSFGGMEDKNGLPISPKQLCKVLKDRDRGPGYQSGQPIRLFICNAGRGDGWFPQQLADLMNVTVYAPTTAGWPGRSGQLEDYELFGRDRQGNRDYSKPGKWVAFLPRNR